MPDEIDAANEKTQVATDAAVAAARSKAMNIPPGRSGECDLCGEWSARLVLGACAGCRDKYKLP